MNEYRDDLRKTIYTASPGGFAESTIRYHKDLVEILRDAGFRVLDPWELTPQSEVESILQMSLGDEKVQKLVEMDRLITDRNIDAICESDMIFATLDGQEVDSGTAHEMGLGFALGLVICGLRSDFRQSGENLGCRVNMQVEASIHNSGGKFYTSLSEVSHDFTWLFETCDKKRRKPLVRKMFV